MREGGEEGFMLLRMRDMDRKGAGERRTRGRKILVSGFQSREEVSR